VKVQAGGAYNAGAPPFWIPTYGYSYTTTLSPHKLYSFLLGGALRACRAVSEGTMQEEVPADVPNKAKIQRTR